MPKWGVGCGLNNVQIVADGTRLGGKPNPEDEFEPVDYSQAPKGNRMADVKDEDNKGPTEDKPYGDVQLDWNKEGREDMTKARETYGGPTVVEDTGPQPKAADPIQDQQAPQSLVQHILNSLPATPADGPTLGAALTGMEPLLMQQGRYESSVVWEIISHIANSANAIPAAAPPPETREQHERKNRHRSSEQ